MKKQLLDDVITQLKNGNNVFITGSIGSGKTTLFQKVVSQLGDVTLIVSQKSASGVELFFGAERAKIGRYIDRRMVSCPRGFDLGLVATKQFLSGATKLLAIDEIGFLEAARRDYLELIVKSAQQKTLFAVLRKENCALKPYLKQLPGYAIIDLDRQ